MAKRQSKSLAMPEYNYLTPCLKYTIEIAFLQDFFDLLQATSQQVLEKNLNFCRYLKKAINSIGGTFLSRFMRS